MFKYSFYFILLCFVTIKGYHFRTDNNQSDRDLPQKEDLDDYLKPIESLSSYLVTNLTDIQINFALGIFLTNVHLGRVLFKKGENLPYDLQTRIKGIVDKNEKSLEYFRSRARLDITFMARDYVIISYLFGNSTYWIKRVKNFNYEAVPVPSKRVLELTYSVWEKYSYNINEVVKHQPNPENSDLCLVTLAINPTNRNTSYTSWCPLANFCYYMIEHGTDFGYALCHRLFILIMAQLGRGCALLSVKEDELLKQKLCTMAYEESEYIATNDYKIPDLMLEIICICGMDGRLQFLRRSWLTKLLEFQKPAGCFGGKRDGYYGRSGFSDCNSHTTGLAAGAYAAAVRFILEEYY